MGVFDRARDASHLGDPDEDRPYLCMRCEAALQVQYHTCPACGAYDIRRAKWVHE